MKDNLKNKKYVEALWDCYQKGILEEELDEKEVFLYLIDDAIDQIIGSLRDNKFLDTTDDITLDQFNESKE